MKSSRNSGDEGSNRRVKVARLIDQYELNGIGQELEQLWTAEDENRLSLRDLAEYFNQELMVQAMAEAGMQPLDGEVQNLYRLLTSDEVSSADHIRAHRRLKRQGLAVEDLLNDFVTYQAIRTYLKIYRGAEYASNQKDPTEREIENLQRLQGRTSTITASKLEQLRSSNHIILGDFKTIIDIKIFCENCEGQYELGELFDQGGCDCQETSV